MITSIDSPPEEIISMQARSMARYTREVYLYKTALAAANAELVKLGQDPINIDDATANVAEAAALGRASALRHKGDT